MALKTPQQYLESLRDGRVIYWEGRRIEDITTDPLFQVPLSLVANDYQYRDEEYGELRRYRTEDGGEAHRIYQIPRTADDLGDYWQPGPLLVPPPPVADSVFNQRTQVPFAKDKVRHVGEPIALVIASSRYIAEDALADIAVDFDILPAVIEPKAIADLDLPPVSLVHDDLDNNVAARVHQRKGDYASAKAKADVVIRRKFYYDHGTAAPMETRGVVAHWDARAGKLTIWDTTQAPVVIRNGLAAMLGLNERQVRVIAPFIGGGFGPKIMMFYPEEVVIPWAAMQLNCPVKWIEDRNENFVAMTHERAQTHEAEMALSKDGKILGIWDRFIHDTGAYDPYGLTVPLNSQCTLLSIYHVPNYDSEFTAVFTNKPIVTPYRGAGRQHGIFVMERLLDEVSFEAPRRAGTTVTVDAEMVNQRLGDLVRNEDLSRYIL